MWLYNKFFRIVIFLKIIWYKILFKNKITFGKKLRFRKRLNIICTGTGKIVIGNNVFFNNDVSLNALKKIEIGNNTIIGENVKIYDHDHIFNNKYNIIKEQGYKTSEVIIGNNVWIGSNVCILKGVTIGDNSVIGAGCIVKNNIPPNVILKTSNNYTIEKIIYKE